MSPSKKILICISGSISAYKAASLASALKKKGHEVKTVATESALKFIGPAALEGITGQPVLTDMFNPGYEIPHINLSEWADMIVLYPASATTLARLRMGLAEDLLSAIFLSNNFRKPYWICPAMNINMLEHPAVQENLKILEKWGARIIDPDEGVLACGTVGKGRAPEPVPLAEMIEEAL
ncbi:flavoprotein [Spirochaeta isovalerica]|uniref:Phosphopantothenoylcysteine decarboxylase/phosphopantothenate--cysteine ligase n=1 Tax=Spirochaeta isovalerica TaxID=150 RepID=A0A841RA74_9SPIO|nr:flavoprotein [Spirochaeta isovalerica]MBB6479829.1 phosphopantothenoylcysteine decarboxylase/phosphopantothenate--cysteine ligase [Spirochaeta isovalerica]